MLDGNEFITQTQSRTRIRVQVVWVEQLGTHPLSVQTSSIPRHAFAESFLYPTDRRNDAAGCDRGFVDFGADSAEGVADGVGDGGGRGDGAAFAHAFHAVFGVRCRRVQIADLDCRHLGSAGHQIIGQCAGQRLAGFVIRDFLEQGSSDALDDEQQIDNRASLAGC